MTGRSTLVPVFIGEEGPTASIVREQVCDVTAALNTALRLGSELPHPGDRSTSGLWGSGSRWATCATACPRGGSTSSCSASRLLPLAARAPVVSSIDAVLADGGSLVACHWRGRADDMAQSGDDVQAAVTDAFDAWVVHEDPDFAIVVAGLRR